jgi:hypothetical protein
VSTHLDYLPAREWPCVAYTAVKHSEPVKNYLEQFVPTGALSDDAVGLMNYKFEQLNHHVL